MATRKSKGSKPYRQPKKHRSAAQLKYQRQQHIRAQNTAKNAVRTLKRLGLYNPVEDNLKRPISKSRRRYLSKLANKFADFLDTTKYIPVATAKKPKEVRKRIKQQAADIGIKATDKVVFVPRKNAEGTTFERASIKYDKSLKKYTAVRTRRVRKPGRGKPARETSTLTFADFDTMTLQQRKLAKRFADRKMKPGTGMRFIVYARGANPGVSRNIWSDFDLLMDAATAYKSFSSDPTGFIQNLEIIVVDENESRDSIYNRFFDPTTGKFSRRGNFAEPDIDGDEEE